MYRSANFTSDLINSYAWDTAIVFIQECSGDKNYSTQIGENTETYLQKVGESTLANVDSGDESKDVRCNIYDMAGNTMEWTTETYSRTYEAGVFRGGNYANSGGRTRSRSNTDTTPRVRTVACRSTLYL